MKTLKICLTAILISTSSACTTLITPDCLWFIPVKLSDEDKAALSRDGKEQIARNNINYDKLCPN